MTDYLLLLSVNIYTLLNSVCTIILDISQSVYFDIKVHCFPQAVKFALPIDLLILVYRNSTVTL